jgi:hypothetical protein
VPGRGSRKRRKPSRPTPDRALETRKRHALKLVRDGRIDGELALVWTVWPRGRLEAPPARTVWPAELAEEARRLYADGWSMPAIAQRLMVGFGTVKTWVLAGEYRRGHSRPRVVASA